jgi:heme O synthase-like polyprenyltransferase
MSAFFISENAIIATVFGFVAIIYAIFYFYNESVDKKRRKYFLVSVVIIVALKIFRLLL